MSFLVSNRFPTVSYDDFVDVLHATRDYVAFASAIENDRATAMAEMLECLPWKNRQIFLDGGTPLHYAVECNSTECTRTLLALGANPSLRSFGTEERYGVTPLGLARRLGRRAEVEALLAPVTPRTEAFDGDFPEDHDGPLWFVQRRDGEFDRTFPFEDVGSYDSETYRAFFAVGRTAEDNIMCEAYNTSIVGGYHPKLRASVAAPFRWFESLVKEDGFYTLWTVAEDHEFYRARPPPKPLARCISNLIV